MIEATHQPPDLTADVRAVTMDGPLALDSAFYIERPPLEAIAYQTLAEPGSLLRLKGPRHTGKSSLLLRLQHHAQSLGYRIGTVDFLQAEAPCLENLDRCLRWFCRVAARQLGIEADLDSYWDAEIGSKVSATLYLEQAVLSQSDRPLVLTLNEINRVFAQGAVATEFLSLLRFWFEEAQRSPIWQKLRLVIAYATEFCVPLKLEQSPFNVGIPLKLPPFTLAQTEELARRYGLGVESDADTPSPIAELHELVGGHPYLVHRAIAQFHQTPDQIAALLATATNPVGLYGAHLRHHGATLRQTPELLEIVQSLLQKPAGIPLAGQWAYQLDSLGIVQIDGNQCRFLCELYRRYLTVELQSPINAGNTLAAQNQKLQKLAYTDALTTVPNRRAFDEQLNRLWESARQRSQPLTLMLCDVDHFKTYNDTHGHPIGDQCLQLVAQILRQGTRMPEDFLARYGGEEFALIMINTSIEVAETRAEELRSRVSFLTTSSHLPGVTISIGVATVVPDQAGRAHRLLAAADRVLYESKRLGRDRVTLISSL